MTALDFSEAMLKVARRKHAGHKKKVRFILADAESTVEDEASYEAIICRHLVWTLTEPEQAFSDWRRILRPGGLLLIFDGDWARPTLMGRAASLVIHVIDLLVGADPHHGGMSDRHAAIMAQLPFGGGLTTKRLVPMLADAGFADIQLSSQWTIAVAQRKHATLRNKLRTLIYRRFVLSCRKSGEAGGSLRPHVD
ncbi:ubiquinone/menaquinone biosynthesis C-methylase UbiE [Labrys monachus]|uniref:Ubiquinone/menaquinone biosynthesis C-methylase UbiE n=1 Tax=Labrys monachus TaxID=217067 RepID=A0ABU0F704_9HYPH|nr:ubiquinone/menaquinone biosynthesis C-methylase UbiE [Labrys monachus]